RGDADRPLCEPRLPADALPVRNGDHPGGDHRADASSDLRAAPQGPGAARRGGGLRLGEAGRPRSGAARRGAGLRLRLPHRCRWRGDRLLRARRTVGKTGVERGMGSRVTGVDAGGLDGRSVSGDVSRIDARTVIWAAGVAASPLGRLLAEGAGAETDRAGRVKVLPDCTLPNHPEVFVVGDMMSLDGLPGVAEVAMQSGLHAARTSRSRRAGNATQ